MKYCDHCRSSYPNEFNVCPIDNSPLCLTSELFPGITIRDKYLVLDKVGEGGMGAVYRARHLAFNEIRALKVVHASLVEDRGFVKRFKTEAIVARKLQHPNAVRIDDLDSTEDGRPFIVMEMVEGGSLKTLIAQVGVFPVARAVSVAAQTADALAAAHQLGIVHRDIKPDNILVARAPDGSDLVKVADFGIAKVHEGAIDIGSGYTATRSGMIVGTPQYLSPEQAMGMHGDQIDGRADLYSVGIVLYVMLTGQLPFDSDTPMGFLMHHVQTKPPAPHLVRPDLRIPPALSTLLMKALEKDRERRFATADEMAQALRDAQPGSATVMYPPAAPQASQWFRAAPQSASLAPVPQAHGAAQPALAVQTPPPVFAEHFGETPLPAGIEPSANRSRARIAIWAAAGVVVVGAMTAAAYFSGTLIGRRSQPQPPAVVTPAQPTSSEAQVPASSIPAQYGGTSQAAPAAGPENGAPKSTVEAAPEPAPHSTEGSAAPSSAVAAPERPAKRQTSAAKELERPPRKPPKPDVSSLVAAGKLAHENAEYDKAITSFHQALQNDPGNAEAAAGLSKARSAKQAEEQVLQHH